MSDWADDAAFRVFADQVRAELLPKLRNTHVVVSLLGRNRADVKFAVETGFAVLLNKPIIVVVTPGAKVPDKLIRVADRIIEADLSTPTGRDAMAEALNAVVAELDKGDADTDD